MSNLGHILLVEDDMTLADWVSEYLIDQHYQVTHVERGDKVMEVF